MHFIVIHCWNTNNKKSTYIMKSHQFKQMTLQHLWFYDVVSLLTTPDKQNFLNHYIKLFDTFGEAFDFIVDKHKNGQTNYPDPSVNFDICVYDENLGMSVIVRNGQLMTTFNNTVKKVLTPQEKWDKVMGKH